MGRHIKYSDIEALKLALDQYFSDCDKSNTPYTITGLALALGTTRQSLWDYQHETQDETYQSGVWQEIIEDAKTKVENYAEKKLFNEKGSPAGAIFALKGHGWKDTHDVNANQTITTRIVNYKDGDTNTPQL
jgi:hypothetical protein